MSFWKKLFGGKESPTGSDQSSVSASLKDIEEAVKSGDLERVKALVKVNRNLACSKDSDGGTPLHIAASRGHKDIVNFLIANKADVNAQGWGGFTPLHYAAGSGHKDVAGLLLANKAKVNVERKSGETALHLAAYEGHIETVEVLLANGADVNADSHGDYKTPLRTANAAGHTAVAELLKKHGGHE